MSTGSGADSAPAPNSREDTVSDDATATTTGSAPGVAAGPAATPRQGMFSSLRIRNYRLFATGQMVSNTGTWMQRIAQDWLVLSLTGGSSAAVGVTTALQFLPMLLFGLYGGVIADRFSKRTLLLITQSAMGLTGLALAVLTLSGHVQVWHVYLVAFALGLVTVLDNPSRQAFVSEMVGQDDLRNAVSLNSANFQSARLIGPAVAGVLITAFGSGWAFLLNGLSFIAPLAGLLMMRTAELHKVDRVPRSKGQLREGLRYVSGRPDLIWTIVLVGFIGTFGFNFPIWLTAFVYKVFHEGAGTYAFFNGLMAAGSLIGALLAARRATSRLRLLVGAAMLFGALEITAALAPSFWIFAVLLVPIGVVGLHGQCHGELQRAAGHRSADARPGDEPVHDGLHGRYAARCPARRLDHRRLRRPDRLPGGRRDLGGGRGDHRADPRPRRRSAAEDRSAPRTPPRGVRPAGRRDGGGREASGGRGLRRSPASVRHTRPGVPAKGAGALPFPAAG